MFYPSVLVSPYCRQIFCLICFDSDLIFSIPKIISFLSQGTTLKPGTVILTG